MKLLEDIRQRLSEKELVDFVKALGYYNIPKGKASLKKLTNCKELSEWIASGHYDLVYNVDQLLEAVTNELGIDIMTYRDEIVQAKNEYREDQNFRKCRFRVECSNTGNSCVMHMYYLNTTRIPLDPWIIKSRKLVDILDSISELVRKHYNLNNGEFLNFGNILDYYYIHHDRIKYTFDNSGRLIKIAPFKIKKKTVLESFFGVRE